MFSADSPFWAGVVLGLVMPWFARHLFDPLFVPVRRVLNHWATLAILRMTHRQTLKEMRQEANAEHKEDHQ